MKETELKDFMLRGRKAQRAVDELIADPLRGPRPSSDMRASNTNLRRNINRLMKERGIGQRDIEAMSGGRISQAAISYILSDTHSARLSTVDELARIFNVKPWELIR